MIATTFMDIRERDRNLRRRFGPPGNGDRPPARADQRPPGRSLKFIVGAIVAAILLSGAVTAFVGTPHDHVAPGCFWWTATAVGEVTLGRRGCVRGVLEFAGGLAESTDPGSPVLPMVYADPNATRPHVTCPFRSGDLVVVRYHTAFDDGRTFIVVDDCR